jgi:hypothetical protein
MKINTYTLMGGLERMVKALSHNDPPWWEHKHMIRMMIMMTTL